MSLEVIFFTETNAAGHETFMHYSDAAQFDRELLEEGYTTSGVLGDELTDEFDDSEIEEDGFDAEGIDPELNILYPSHAELMTMSLIEMNTQFNMQAEWENDQIEKYGIAICYPSRPIIKLVTIPEDCDCDQCIPF